MSKQEMLKMQTCVLRVNIQCHCDGCKNKIRKLLQKIDGVYSTQVNAEQGRVLVTGNVDPVMLIKKLEKSGKHAEIWGVQKGSVNNNHQNHLNSFKNMKLDGGKGGGGGNNNKSQKGGKGQQVQQQMQQFKGYKDMKMGNKVEQKSVKFNLPDPDEFGGSDDDFDDDLDDYDDDFEEDEDEEEEFGHGHRGHQLPNKMMMPMKGNNPKGGGGGGGGNGKKKGAGVIEIPVVGKGKGGSNDGKKGDSGKKGKSGKGGNGKNNSGKGGKDKKQDGKDKKGGKTFGGLLGFFKRSKSGREIISDDYDFSDNEIILASGKSNGNGTKKGGGKNEGARDINKMKQGFPELDGMGGPKMGPMGPMGPLGNYGRMGGMPAVQGLPAQPGMNGGYYQGFGSGNPYGQQQYNQQQQYMAMMMNQQRQNVNEMYQPMAYPRPHPAVNYSYMPPPPMPPPPVADPFTHIFSDENTSGCSVM